MQRLIPRAERIKSDERQVHILSLSLFISLRAEHIITCSAVCKTVIFQLPEGLRARTENKSLMILTPSERSLGWHPHPRPPALSIIRTQPNIISKWIVVLRNGLAHESPSLMWNGRKIVFGHTSIKGGGRWSALRIKAGENSQYASHQHHTLGRSHTIRSSEWIFCDEELVTILWCYIGGAPKWVGSWLICQLRRHLRNLSQKSSKYPKNRKSWIWDGLHRLGATKIKSSGPS